MQHEVSKEAVSIFDILKIGVGPSSSHTLGPWRAAERLIQELKAQGIFTEAHRIVINLYGSLALTGKGHGTDLAIMLGLSGANPETIALEQIRTIPEQIKARQVLTLAGEKAIGFNPEKDILFLRNRKLPYHSNGITFYVKDTSGKEIHASTYYSVGGGFVVHQSETEASDTDVFVLPFPADCAADVLRNCSDGKTLSQMVVENELSWRNQDEIEGRLAALWKVMKESVYKGCHTEGKLPGGLGVVRRAAHLNRKLLKGQSYDDVDQWISAIKSTHYEFSDIITWIGCFAMAVNEENANFGRIVTAPTNGSAGVIPSVLLYYLCFSGRQVGEKEVSRFLLVAGELGILFKKGSTLSAAMGGCQAEIGVSSAMAAGALTEGMGGSVQQTLMAAEIAMEHHLGLTCDPVAGLVQIPCIERNSMGAVKAITASQIALDSNPAEAKVSLDNVIKSMWETAKDMKSKYKETSKGGLAANISVKVSEC